MEGLYHVWLSTKGRKPVLADEIGGEVKRLLAETADRTGIQLLEAEVVADHAHLLVAVAETQTLSSVLHQLKGATARAIFLKYPDLRFDLSSDSFWQRGYGWRKIELKEVPAVRNYIRTQRERRLRHDA